MTHNIIIKICGIRDARTLEAIIAAGADMVGFVHFGKSPRHLSLVEIGTLVVQARGRIQSVVLLVDPDDELVGQVKKLAPDIIQLHGHESPKRVEQIRFQSGIETMKALPIGGPEDILAIRDYLGVADRLLLDAKPPKEAKRPGGLGAVFDWSLLKALDGQVEYMLSGGLNPANVAAAINKVWPVGVDVSSGVEKAPGEKDIDMISSFIANARHST
ncbi:Phosphoribosylanthranilate isomerase [hydrothermal vent metagenome]|uniref:phosphoribosylanthranilate isomerase n=1 Tax=hydrothermal vent metagenome TaxID=652676 RepID=A0A3B0TUX9_9ZZZZ